MIEKPRTFEEWWSSQTEQFRRTHSASDYFGGWDARDEEVAEKDRRIVELEIFERKIMAFDEELDRRRVESSQLQAQIDQVRALVAAKGLMQIYGDELLAALGEPAATPEREQKR